ncbi:hypothetical protein BGX27_009624 [Mortierella sp. AM989]|nr:hypothetical protein BGX27_009624 [Mortierella sp. AM989]
MRFTAAATLLVLATTALAEPWKPMGGDLAYVGPAYNATFKAGDTIPLEYTFHNPKIVSNNVTAPTNGTAPIIKATITSLSWVGNTDNKTLDVQFDNGRADGLAVACLAADRCSGTYYPKRIELTIPSDVYPSNYTIILGYTLTLTGNKTIYYKQPVNIVDSSSNFTSPVATIPNAPAVKVTLPVFSPPSSGLANQVPKALVGMTIMLVSAMLIL